MLKKSLLIASIALSLSAVSIEETLKSHLSGKTYQVAGDFGHYDFDNAAPAWDWAFTTVPGGKVYQLQGNMPSQNDVFGWKLVDIKAPSAPAWQMFPLGEDIDGDGDTKFDWILVGSGNYTGFVFKLNGVKEDGTFDYSNAIDIKYSVLPASYEVTFESVNATAKSVQSIDI